MAEQTFNLMKTYSLEPGSGSRVNGPAAVAQEQMIIENSDVKYVSYDIATSIDRMITLENTFASKDAEIKSKQCNLRTSGGGVTTYSPLPGWYTALGLDVAPVSYGYKLTLAFRGHVGYPVASLGVQLGFQATDLDPADQMRIVTYVNTIGYNQPNPPIAAAPGVFKYTFDLNASPGAKKRVVAYLWSFIELHKNYDGTIVTKETNANLNLVHDPTYSPEFDANAPTAVANDLAYSDICSRYGDETLICTSIVTEVHFNNTKMISDGYLVTSGSDAWGDFMAAVYTSKVFTESSLWNKLVDGNATASKWFGIR